MKRLKLGKCQRLGYASGNPGGSDRGVHIKKGENDRETVKERARRKLLDLKRERKGTKNGLGKGEGERNRRKT